ncbi:MAG: response regulator, partial [Alphaproteobacteria bacterium]|nr:response regulator [Alphaproteobacteria bacterium]
SILGMLRLIKESGLNREQFTLADTAFRSSTNLLEIINDILDLSKIDAGGMKLERIGFDPRYVLKSSVDTLEQLSKEKRIPIVSHFEHEAMPYVLGDPTRMGRIFINLISNAIKYTDRGHVDISASCIAIDDKYTVFRCEVKDTGIGIPENKRAAIFEKFVQADTSTTRKYGGTGLGLAITRELVEMMGGKIGVDSVVGLGSTFWISIPFETTPTLHKEKQIRREKMLSGIIPPADARILIAEDHIMNQLFMKKLMQNFGITHYKIVASGTAALKAYIEKPWDVILMDCHMPEKNGYDTTIEIRELEKQSGKHIPIIAMTANAISGDREKCLRVGMDEYMSKPIDIDTLKETLGQWIRFEDIIDSHDHTDAPPAENDAAFDLSMLQNLTGGDKAIEKELIEAFIAQSDENIAALEKTQNSEAEHAAWAQAAHMLKGGAANLGAKNLIELCEKAQHFNGNLDEKTQIFAKISSEYKRIKAVLSQMGY